jgi:hypothetical protein
MLLVELVPMGYAPVSEWGLHFIAFCVFLKLYT